jgi:hypothetical protein
MNPSEIPHEAKIDINETTGEYSVCCSRTSVGFIRYIATYSITLAVMIFSMIQIASNPQDNNTIFFSLISSILTLYIPSPALPTKPAN